MEKFYKNRGETLADMMVRARAELCVPADMKATYAGRLDPMATGIVPILYGEDVHRKEFFMGHDKTYEVEILLGVSTDTGDVLGVIESEESFTVKQSREEIKNIVEQFKGEHIWNYPRFSSKTVNGVPMFQASKEGRITKEDTPKRIMNIKSIKYVNLYTKNKHEIITGIIKDINKVKGEFRQDEIISGWKTLCEEYDADAKFTIVLIRTTVVSGTYMRVLAEKVGEKLKVPALAFSIKRTSIDFGGEK